MNIYYYKRIKLTEIQSMQFLNIVNNDTREFTVTKAFFFWYKLHNAKLVCNIRVYIGFKGSFVL